MGDLNTFAVFRADFDERCSKIHGIIPRNFEKFGINLLPSYNFRQFSVIHRHDVIFRNYLTFRINIIFWLYFILVQRLDSLVFGPGTSSPRTRTGCWTAAGWTSSRATGSSSSTAWTSSCAWHQVKGPNWSIELNLIQLKMGPFSAISTPISAMKDALSAFAISTMLHYHSVINPEFCYFWRPLHIFFKQSM